MSEENIIIYGDNYDPKKFESIPISPSQTEQLPGADRNMPRKPELNNRAEAVSIQGGGDKPCRSCPQEASNAPVPVQPQDQAQSETPRTDYYCLYGDAKRLWADFARGLERELNAARLHAHGLQRVVEGGYTTIEKLKAELAELRKYKARIYDDMKEEA